MAEMEFNPLDQPVNEKSYTASKAKFDKKALEDPIPEPKSTAPPSDETTISNQQLKSKPSASTDAPKPEKSDEERKSSAKAAAQIAIGVYKMLHHFGGKAIQISPSKINSLVNEKKLNLSMPLLRGNQQVTTKQYIEINNRECEDVLKVDPEFISEVTPVLERVLEKKGAGVSDENNLMFIVGMDIVKKGFDVVRIVKQNKQLIEQLIDISAQYNQVIAAMPMQPPLPPQEKQQSQGNQPPLPINDSDYMNEESEFNIENIIRQMQGVGEEETNHTDEDIFEKTEVAGLTEEEKQAVNNDSNEVIVLDSVDDINEKPKTKKYKKNTI